MLNTLFILLFFFQNPNGVERSIKNYLDSRLDNYDKYEYTIISTPSNLKNYSIDTLKIFKQTGNFGYIPVKGDFNKTVSTSSFIIVRLRLFKHVLIASNNIKADENLSRRNFDEMLLDITRFNGTTLDVNTNLINLRSKVFIKKGSVLLKELVEPIPEILAGSPITALTVKGSVVIKTDAFAKQDGNSGELISITTKDKKYFKAKVLNSYEVLIIE